MQYTVAVAGATGYAGGEALRILADHPNFMVTTVAGHSAVGDRLGMHLPNNALLADMPIEECSPQVLNGHDVIILALPNGASGRLAKDLDHGSLVVDLGADHRLERRSDWDRFYGGSYAHHWSYAMPELIIADGEHHCLTKQRDSLKGSRRLAGPGCNVTAVTLALQPGIAQGLVNTRDMVADLVVGYSGAGKKSQRTNLLAAEALGSAQAYSVAGVHRHIPEIIQNLTHAAADSSSQKLSLCLTPVLVPMSRGILACVSTGLSDEAQHMSDGQIRQAWTSVYVHEPFVTLLPEGQLPATANVVGSNAAHIQVSIDRRAGRICIFAAIDNLTKGTAGQAIQSMNIALELPEDTGLSKIGVAP